MRNPVHRSWKALSALLVLVFLALWIELSEPTRGSPDAHVESLDVDALSGAIVPLAPHPAIPPPVESAEGPEPRPDRTSPRVRVEPGTAARYLQPYLTDQVLAEVWADGTQVYEAVPFEVLQPDGSMQLQSARIEVRPTDPVPIED